MDSDLRNYRDPMDLDPKHCPLGFELDMVRLCPLALLKLLMSFNEKIFFFPNSFCSQGPVLRPGIFYFMDNIWQDAGIRTQVAATAARCATNELTYHIYTNYIYIFRMGEERTGIHVRRAGNIICQHHSIGKESQVLEEPFC